MTTFKVVVLSTIIVAILLSSTACKPDIPTPTKQPQTWLAVPAEKVPNGQVGLFVDMEQTFLITGNGIQFTGKVVRNDLQLGTSFELKTTPAQAGLQMKAAMGLTEVVAVAESNGITIQVIDVSRKNEPMHYRVRFILPAGFSVSKLK